MISKKKPYCDPRRIWKNIVSQTVPQMIRKSQTQGQVTLWHVKESIILKYLSDLFSIIDWDQASECL